MKKSKILIPAFAVLALSVGASVTGTVAWFTAAKTASINISNVAAVNTAGDLSVTLTPMDSGKGGATINGKSAELTPLLDSSFDGTYRYTPITTTTVDEKGTSINNITGLRKLDDTKEIKKSLTVVGQTGTVDAYYLNEFNMQFTTSSQDEMYLLFSPTKSKLDGYDRTNDNIYNALRVMYSFGDSKIIWAPYTYESAVFVANIEGNELSANVKTPFSADAEFVSDNYKTAEDKLLVKNYESNRIKNDENDFTEVSSKVAVDASKSLLSKALKAGVHADVKVSIWFEGLDSDCLAKSSDVQTTAAKILGKVLNMVFYALPTSGFAA